MMHGVDRAAHRPLRDQCAAADEEYQRRRDGLDQLRQQLAALTVDVQSPDGLVRAQVDARGRLTDLTIAPGALGHGDAAALAAAIMATATAAGTAATERVRALVSAQVPDESGLGDFVRSADPAQLLRRHDAQGSADARSAP